MDFGGNSRSESKSRSSSSSSGSGSSSSSSSERTNVYMKLRYGTKTFEPDTKCRSCGDQAEGVLKTESSGLTKPLPICEDKRKEIQEEYGEDWEKMTYRRFEDGG